MPDGQRVLSGSDPGPSACGALDGTLENTFQLHTKWTTAVVALPDNQHALSGSYDDTVKLFNVNDGAALRTFKHHTSWVLSLALLPTASASSAARTNTARIAYHGLATL